MVRDPPDTNEKGPRPTSGCGPLHERQFEFVGRWLRVSPGLSPENAEPDTNRTRP